MKLVLMTLLTILISSCSKDGKLSSIDIGEVKHVKIFSKYHNQKLKEFDECMNIELNNKCTFLNLGKFKKYSRHQTGYGMVEWLDVYCENGNFSYRSYNDFENFNNNCITN